MARLGRVREREWRHAVLERIGECQEPAFTAGYTTQVLREIVMSSVFPGVGLESKYAQEGELALLVLVEVIEEPLVSAVAEGESVVGDVLAVVVVDSRGADPLVLYQWLAYGIHLGDVVVPAAPQCASFHHRNLASQA